MNDMTMLLVTIGFFVSSWLLVVLCDRLMGGKP